MGNGPGIKDKTLLFDIETGGIDDFIHPSTPPLSLDQLEKAAQVAMSNFGMPTQIMVPPKFFMMSGIVFEVNPEYRGTPWASTARMTKREHAVAGLHTTLKKLGVFKKLSEDNLEEIKNKSIRRLKRARWARYQQKKA
jgi:hypothetical protein